MYFELDGNSAMMTTTVTSVNSTHKSLISGCIIDEETEKLPYVFTYDDPAGNPVPDFFKGKNIMSMKMLNVLKGCGVENIQVLPLTLIDKNSKRKREDYIVFNIIGLVSCAGQGESNFSPFDGGDFYQKRVINAEGVKGLSIFRVKESTINIIVSEDVAKALDVSEIRGIILTSVADIVE